LICDVAPEVPHLLRGDPDRLRQILVNILANAVKFTNKGEVCLTVDLAAEYHNTATLRFKIKDTGIGFPEEQAVSLFAPFVQADGSVTRKYGGTGLGLTIAKDLVEMMGGRIGAHSKPGSGSLFWVTVVLEKQEMAAEPVNRPNFGPQAPRVLIVDDNGPNRSLLSRTLKSCGCRCEEAADADSALAALRRAQGNDSFQVVLLDSTLPVIDGQALGKAIASDVAIRGPALFLMAPIGHEGDLSSLLEDGFAGRLAKPVWEDALYESLRLKLQPERPGESKPMNGSNGAVVSAPVAKNTTGRVLVVEDNPTNQQVAAAILNKLGYSNETVGNGREALERLRKEEFDIVLLDCEMPELDGYETVRRIRADSANPRNSTIPVIAVTAHAMRGDREKCVEAGMNDYLSKPIEPEQVSRMLSKWLDRADRAPQCSVPATGSDRVFDETALLTRLSGDRPLARQIVAAFVSDAPRQLQELRQLAEREDVAGVDLHAHRLKGAAATVGASALCHVSEKVQRTAKEGRRLDFPALLSSLDEEFDRLKSELRRLGWVEEPAPKGG
jgi:CheY-like chemotaxis protein